MLDTKKLVYYYSYQSVIIIIQIIISIITLCLLNHSIFRVLSLLSMLYCIGFLRRPITKIDTFIILNKIYLIAVIVIGLAIGEFIKRPSLLIGIIIGVTVSDVLSFTNTRIGEKTTNSIVSRKNSLLEKLFIYANINGYNQLLPILGVGDIIFYSLLVSSLYKINQDYLPQSFFLLAFGAIINFFCILFTHKRIWYKGFPGTLGPAITFAIFILVYIT